MSRESALVTADWVEENLDNDNVVLIEVDEDTTAYDKNHIRNAITFNWHSDLTDPVRHDVLKKEQFEALLSANGITNDDTIVLYGGNANWFAAYAYWEFKLHAWDVCAGTLIVTEAGGSASDLHGEPPPPSGAAIISSNGLLHDEILALLRE